MCWENVEADRFDWSYARSDDDGDTWTTLWRSGTAVSYSWVDPHFAALYARREEERLAERLATRVRERSACEPRPHALHRCEAGWMENDVALRGGHLRLL